MYEIKLKIKHECPYLDLASYFDINLYLYCSDFFDLLIIPKSLDNDEIKQVMSIIKNKESIEITKGGLNGNTTYIHFECMCDPIESVSPNIQKLGGLLELPVLYKNGWEYYKIICINKKTQSSVLEYIQSIEDYKILSIVDLGRDVYKYQFLTTQELLNNLTDKQMDVLISAFDKGYYQIPRSTKTEELAQSYDISRPALEKSLRKAENTIMSSIIPYLLFHQRYNASFKEIR
ncbi:MAG: helix-turn-helix domain-containing protein [Candidatus Heimdallarchaeota archaeon]|nr:helix-turn-helix domain-containing protein [Candidatus Heimdallarchaeota archaeon]MDH5647129.1 helix-turn-helix domain-containing protein [Candidatus Heimdallarchaeota archaeon]